MAANKGTRVFGARLSYGDGATPEVFTSVARIVSLNPISLSRESSDVTALDSPEGFREFCGTIADAGEVSFNVKFMPANETHGDGTGLLSQINDGDNRNYRVEFNNQEGTIWNLTGHISQLSVTGEVAGTFDGSVTIKISGKPSFS